MDGRKTVVGVHCMSEILKKMLNPLVYEMNLRLFLNFYLIALQVQNKYRITKIPTELSGKEN